LLKIGVKRERATIKGPGDPFSNILCHMIQAFEKLFLRFQNELDHQKLICQFKLGANIGNSLLQNYFDPISEIKF
jgi:hypothetical protein